MKLDPLSFKISVVIATRNRFDRVSAAVRSIEAQSLLPKEIIIVDASDNDLGESLKSFVPLKWVKAQPSVCAQRNLGIKSASSDWIFLCDDDIELAKDYLEKLAQYAQQKNSTGALAGLLLQKEKGEWVKNYPVRSFRDLFWRFVFQQSVWGDIQVRVPTLLGPLHRLIVSFYARRGNSTTLGGWPLITQWNEPVIQTRFYSLGANLIRKEWLLQSPFDESLDAHGIGDNYGVAQNFPAGSSIHIVTSTFAYHHRANENRLNQSNARYLRFLALHYFLRKSKAGTMTILFFYWSLVGYSIYSLTKDRRDFFLTLKAMGILLFKSSGRNNLSKKSSTETK